MDGVPWGQFSVAAGGWVLFSALAMLVVRSMVRGTIVPRSSLDDALHDRDQWRAESRIKDSQIATKDQQLTHLAEVGETQKAILKSLGSPASQEDQ